MAKYQVKEMVRIGSLILSLRGLRVMLDSDLAKIYGVTTGALNQALKRNIKRFPDDFTFQLSAKELEVLISQIVISKKGSGGRRKLPWVFTEHGAIMLASILNSERAVEMSVSVVRAFVLMREQLTANKELAQKLSELESRVSGHDEAIQNLFETIRQLIEPPLPEDRKQIGFMRETSPPYRVKTQKRF
ncbi:MAG TPA: ORF6N domain-containing protein [Verrucomicrobiae bacterium]